MRFEPLPTNSRDLKVLIRDVQPEFQRHHFGEFHELGIPEPMRGCLSCRRVIASYPHFMAHLILTPAGLRKATNPTD